MRLPQTRRLGSAPPPPFEKKGRKEGGATGSPDN